MWDFVVVVVVVVAATTTTTATIRTGNEGILRNVLPIRKFSLGLLEQRWIHKELLLLLMLLIIVVAVVVVIILHSSRRRKFGTCESSHAMRLFRRR